ncbi:MAG TPA: hypothetical protein VGK58_13260, partial [Lacipirellulaceae bacterium]
MRSSAGYGFAVWTAIYLISLAIFSPMRNSACAAPPRVSSFAPTPVSSPTAPLEVVLPPSPPAGNTSPVFLRVASQPVESPSNALAPVPGLVAPSAGALPYTPTTSELTSQLLPAVQRGYALAQRGA